jgi:hypothetical protein
VLRCGTSNDRAGAVPLEQRGWKLAEKEVSLAIGEPVETVLKGAWPDHRFPDLIDRWMTELQPDMVVLQVNNFWYGHESAPLWFERRFGRAGKPLNRVGQKVRTSPWFSDNRWAQMFNRRVLAVLPKATHFSIPEVTACMERAMRRILAHEGTVLLVRGNEDWAVMPMATRGFNRRNAARNASMSASMRELCEQLRVPYFQRPRQAAGDELTQNNAGFHNSPEAERQMGAFDSAAMASAWREAHSPATRA